MVLSSRLLLGTGFSEIRSDTVGELRNVRNHPPQWVSIIYTGRANSSESRDLGALK